MDLSLTAEQEMLRDGARRFVAEHYDFEKRRALVASERGFSLDHWRMLGELGWLALGLPEDVGGIGGSAVDTALLMETFGTALVLEPYASNMVLAARILERSDNRKLRSDTLSAMAEGSTRVALAHFERQARYSLDDVETTARKNGAEYVIRGEKSLVLDGPGADKLIVSARLDGQIALFLVDRALAGLSVHGYRLIDDTRAADVVLDDVRVAEALRLTTTDDTLEVLEEALDRFILAKVAESLGAMEAVLEMTGEYVKSRSQFGQVLFKFQATQHRLAEMFVEVQELRSILYRGLAHIDAGVTARRRAISAAKVVAAGAGRTVAGLGIQLHGGIGMTDEYRVGHYFKKIVTFEKLCGDTDYHLARLGASDH